MPDLKEGEGTIIVECKHCQHQLNPNDDDAPWGPPKNPNTSMGSLTCPGCGNQEDFVDWKSITGRDEPAQPA